MSITYTIDHIVTAPSGEGEVEPILHELKGDFLSGLTALAPTITKDGETIQPFTAAIGDPAYPAQIVVRSGLQKRASGVVRHNAVTLQTWASSTDSVSGEVVRRQIPMTISWNTPGDLQVEPGDILRGLEGLFVLLSTASGIVTSARIAKLQFGITDLF